MSDMILRLSPEESRRFGIRAARAESVRQGDFPVILEFCQQEMVKLLTMRCDVRETDVVHAASSAGFILMDTLVYTLANPSRVAVAEADDTLKFRLAAPNDAAVVSDIAAAAFVNYVSHYHADPRLSHKEPGAIYVEWAERLCRMTSKDNPMFLAELDGQIVGFAGVRRTSAVSVDCELCAVAPFATGRGVFKAMLSHLAQWARLNQIGELSYSTQLQNNAVLATLTRQGFYFSGARHTFHKWFDE